MNGINTVHTEPLGGLAQDALALPQSQRFEHLIVEPVDLAAVIMVADPALEAREGARGPIPQRRAEGRNVQLFARYLEPEHELSPGHRRDEHDGVIGDKRSVPAREGIVDRHAHPLLGQRKAVASCNFTVELAGRLGRRFHRLSIEAALLAQDREILKPNRLCPSQTVLLGHPAPADAAIVIYSRLLRFSHPSPFSPACGRGRCSKASLRPPRRPPALRGVCNWPHGWSGTPPFAAGHAFPSGDGSWSARGSFAY